MPNSLRRHLPTILVNLVTFLVLALGLEFAVRWLMNHPSHIPGALLPMFQEYYRTEDRSIIQVTDCARYDSGLFYTLKPGICTFQNREFREEVVSNSQGLRDEEESLNYPEVVCLGDSYTMGWGVKQDAAFPQILEKLIGRKVLNAGVSSFGTARETLLLKRLSIDSVKTIIIQVHANDFEENAQFVRNGFKLSVRSHQQYDSLRNEIERRQKYYPFKHLYGVLKQVSRGTGNPISTTDLTSAAQDFLSIVKQAGIPPDVNLMIINIEDKQNLRDDFVLAVDSLSRTKPYENLNLSIAKISSLLDENDYFVLDEHLNASGHLKIATKIRDLSFNE